MSKISKRSKISKISKKGTLSPGQKNPINFVKRYKIAFGIAFFLITIMSITSFALSLTSKFKETMDATPAKFIDDSVNKLVEVFGETKADGTPKTPDKRIDIISKGFAKSLSNGTSEAMGDLLNKLEKFADENENPDNNGEPTKFRKIVDKLLLVPTNKLTDLWNQLKDHTTGNNNQKFQETLTKFFETVHNASKPNIRDMAYTTSFAAGIGLKEALPGILGGTSISMGEAELETALKNGVLDGPSKTSLDTLNAVSFNDNHKKVITLFIKSVNACGVTFSPVFSSLYLLRRSALHLMLQNGLKLEIDYYTKNITIKDDDGHIFVTSVGPHILSKQYDELKEYIVGFARYFGKMPKNRSKNRSNKRSKKRSIKKNKKY